MVAKPVVSGNVTYPSNASEKFKQRLAKYQQNLAQMDEYEQQLELSINEENHKSQVAKHKRELFLCNQTLDEKILRHFLKKSGKSHLLDFTDEEIVKLRECFQSLDEEGEGAISIDQLEQPLIGLGFADTRDEVERMIEMVDEDGSGKIELDEFMLIIKNTTADEKTA